MTMAQYNLSYSSIMSSEDCMLDDLENILSENEVDIESGRRFMLVVSEAFNNAMMHGNRLDASKQIKLSLSINRTRLKADIVDQGVQGLKAIRNKLPCDILSESGRGIDLIRHYADEVDFAEDTKGNLRTTVKIFRTATNKATKDYQNPNGG